jgi:hypothetical protein
MLTEQLLPSSLSQEAYMSHSMIRRIACALMAVCLSTVCLSLPIMAEQKSAEQANSLELQAKLEAALTKMLSGATLEGSFTSTGAGGDPTKLSRDKYTLGDVKKLNGNLWQIPARIQYGEKDVTLPIILPIRWAGDTPVVTVDNLPLPGFGTVSARVIFFEGHYAGYWKHGEHGGSMFGVIHPAEKKQPKTKPSSASRSGGDPPAEK